MKYINQNAPAIGVILLLVGMVVGATVWVGTEINDVRDDLHHSEMRLTEKINENAAGIAEINERLDRIEQRMDRSEQRFEQWMNRSEQRMDRSDQRLETILDAIANHSHAEDGSPAFTRPTAQENPAENESQAAQR